MTAPGSTTVKRRRPVWTALLAVHAAPVLVLIALFLALVLPTLGQPDANIGAGIALLPLLVLGVPWSLPQIIDPYQLDSTTRALGFLAFLGPAVLNVVLHAAVHVVVGRRRARRSQVAQAPSA